MKDKQALERMIFHAERIIRNLSSMTYAQFSVSDPLIDLAILNIGHLGEQIKDLSDDLKKRHPEIEWRKIQAGRNRFFHNYDGIDF